MIPIIFAAMYLFAPSLAQSNSTSCGLLPSDIAANLTKTEPWYCPISQQITNQWESWLPVMMVVTLIAFLVAALIYMAGIAFQRPKLRNFGASEFYEAIVTAIIVIAFVYVCAVLFGLTPGSFIGAINPYATSFNMIGSTITSAQNLYTSIYKDYLPLSEFTSVNIDVSPILASSEISAGASVIGSTAQSIKGAFSAIITVLFLDPAQALSSVLIEGIAVLYGEYYLLVFFAIASIPVFIIPGVIFRAIMPTRGLGGVLIAIGVGFYLVAPTLFATTYYFTAPGVLAGLRQSNAQFLAINNQNLQTTAISPTSPVVLYLENPQSSLNGFWLMIIFYPAMIISFTYAFIVQFAKLIGGTYKASNRIRSFI